MRRSASGQASAFSAQQHGFKSHTSHHLVQDARERAFVIVCETRVNALGFLLQDARERAFVLPVAQLDERPATNREACRFDPCREGQFNRV